MIDSEVRKKLCSSGQHCTARAALQIQCLSVKAHSPEPPAVRWAVPAWRYALRRTDLWELMKNRPGQKQMHVLRSVWSYSLHYSVFFSGYRSDSRAVHIQTLSCMFTSRCLCLDHFSEVMLITEGAWAVLSLQTCTISVQGFRLMGSSWKDGELNWLAGELSVELILEKRTILYMTSLVPVFKTRLAISKCKKTFLSPCWSWICSSYTGLCNTFLVWTKKQDVPKAERHKP